MAGRPARLQPQQRAISITPCFIRFYVLRSAVVPFLHVCHLYYSLFMILQCPRFSVWHSVAVFEGPAVRRVHRREYWRQDDDWRHRRDDGGGFCPNLVLICQHSS